MPWFEIDFKDGKEKRIEADVGEDIDGQWVFRRGDKVIAHYEAAEVRGVRELPPGPVRTRGGMTR